jgi:hypothetical protein
MSGQSIGELLPLENDGKQRALPRVDQSWLGKEPGVDTLDQEFGGDGEINDRRLLGGDGVWTAKVGDELCAPLLQSLAEDGSAVDGPTP